jgi:hypothetical protein
MEVNDNNMEGNDHMEVNDNNMDIIYNKLEQYDK